MRLDSRTKLREFQTQLAERLAQARLTPSSHSRLGLQINDSRWLVTLGEAGEILPLQDIASVPHTLPWYRGLTSVRGVLVSVIDLSLFLGGTATRTDRDSRILSFAPELELNAALLVTRSLGLHNLTNWQEHDAQFIDENAQSWTPLSLRALSTDERFLQISALGNLHSTHT
jgi:twitching motility protein PilI